MMIIDPPSPFDTLEAWQAFLAEMESIEPRTPQVEDAIADARARLRAKRYD
jgi:cytochrome c-type biogenesis protein CcmH/NrfG